MKLQQRDVGLSGIIGKPGSCVKIPALIGSILPVSLAVAGKWRKQCVCKEVWMIYGQHAEFEMKCSQKPGIKP